MEANSTQASILLRRKNYKELGVNLNIRIDTNICLIEVTKDICLNSDRNGEIQPQSAQKIWTVNCNFFALRDL